MGLSLDFVKSVCFCEPFVCSGACALCTAVCCSWDGFGSDKAPHKSRTVAQQLPLPAGSPGVTPGRDSPTVPHKLGQGSPPRQLSWASARDMRQGA